MAKAVSGYEELKFRSLRIDGWRQFRDANIEFHPRLTILTGSNGCGKTTLLNVLAPHFAWQIPLATTPQPILRAVAASVATYVTGVWQALTGKGPASTFESTVGHVEYIRPHITGRPNDEGPLTSEVTVPTESTAHTFTLNYVGLRNLRGVYIPSHRPLFVPTATPRSAARAASALDSVKLDPQTAFDLYAVAVRAPWTGEISPITPMQALKATLLRWFADGVELSTGPSLADQFSEKLAIVMPDTIGFVRIAAQDTEILFETRSGSFAIEAVSGGIAALLDLTWQLFLCSQLGSDQPGEPGTDPARSFVALIDEPENHLHPELQRSVMLRLLQAYPQAQFIVSSHAPLVVTSVRHAWVYAFRYYEQPTGEIVTGDDVADPGDDESPGSTDSWRRYVEVLSLHDFDRAGTADRILRDVLGLDYTMPVWAATILDDAVAAVAESGYSAQAYRELNDTLQSNALNDYAPEALALLSERRDLDAML